MLKETTCKTIKRSNEYLDYCPEEKTADCPTCQPVIVRTTYRNESSFTAEIDVIRKYATGESFIDRGNSKLTQFCCCSKTNKMVYTAPTSFSFGVPALPLINWFNIDLTRTNLNPAYFGDVTFCGDSINKSGELKVTANFGEINKNCYIKDITNFFMERYNKLPPIKGVSLDINFPAREIAGFKEKKFLLDISPQYNETNNSNVVFDYNNSETTIFAKFGLDTSACQKYDENYPDIPTDGVYNENDGKAFYMYFPASASLIGEEELLSALNIYMLRPAIRLQYFNNKIYMTFAVDFRISGMRYPTATVSVSQFREVKKLIDLYEDFNIEYFLYNGTIQASLLKIRGNIYA
jgi:hypothetical protein